jgi:hypothetical protein
MFFSQLLAHQFGVAVRGGCEVVVHGIQTTLDGVSGGCIKPFQHHVAYGHLLRALSNRR